MPGGRVALEDLAEDIAGLGRRALPREAYFSEVAARLRRVVGCDAMCWHTLDPDTLLLTSDSADELIASGIFTPWSAQEAGEQIVACEYMADGVNTFAGLARRRVPVAILGEGPRGPTGSARYERVLAPAGIPFEMRVAFVARGRAWGAVHMARREDRRDFTRADAGVLAHVAGTIADGIRTALRFDAARRPDDPSAPGLVVLGAGGEVQLVTEPARALMPALRGPAPPGADERPPTALLAWAAHARQAARAGRANAGAVAIPTASGYITVHAALPEGRAGGDVALVLERAPSPQATALRLEAHGVTEREREVAALLARGLTNAAIAAQLVLSPYTVQDHIRSLFEKTGVGSRHELVARIFLDDYLPRVAAGAALGAHGAFA